MVTRHNDYHCKECDMKLPTFLHLLKHVLENHFKDQREIKEDNSKDDDILNYQGFSFDTEREYEKDSGFVFKKSTLDEFL